METLLGSWRIYGIRIERDNRFHQGERQREELPRVIGINRLFMRLKTISATCHLEAWEIMNFIQTELALLKLNNKYAV